MVRSRLQKFASRLENAVVKAIIGYVVGLEMLSMILIYIYIYYTYIYILHSELEIIGLPLKTSCKNWKFSILTPNLG